MMKQNEMNALTREIATIHSTCTTHVHQVPFGCNAVTESKFGFLVDCGGGTTQFLSTQPSASLIYQSISPSALSGTNYCATN